MSALRVSRRSLLIGAGAAVLVGAGAVAEPHLHHGADRVVHRDPGQPETPHGKPGQVLDGSFDSTARHAPTGWSIAYPPGTTAGDAVPMLLVLHGRGDDHRAVLGSHALGSYLAGAVRTGTRPFALVAVDGGDHDYWHPRASGSDAQAMLIDELLPLAARHGLLTDRFAVGGWSMGGYGALLLAERLGPRRIAAVAVDSPAIWNRAADTAPGAFDSRDDFERHDVLRRAGALGQIPLRVTCGDGDPFLPGVGALLRTLPQAQHDIGRGGHDLTWWHHAAPGQLAFVGAELARA